MYDLGSTNWINKGCSNGCFIEHGRQLIGEYQHIEGNLEEYEYSEYDERYVDTPC